MIESLDEFYSANLGEEVTRGMRESASCGFYLYSTVQQYALRLSQDEGKGWGQRPP